MWQQLAVNGLVATSTYLLVGVSFAIIYRVTRFFHFAHGAVFTVGAYSTLVFTNWLGLPLIPSLLLGVLSGAVIGVVMELCVYRPLRSRSASPLILLLASLGIYIVLQNFVSMVFGDATKSIRSGVIEAGIRIWGARITPTQILTACLSVCLAVAVAFLIRHAKIGTAMRAVACDPELASVSGVESNRVILWTFALGSALAAGAGLLSALDVDMTPTMGLNALMMGVVAVVVGGVGSIPGVALGALLLAMAQHVGVWKIGSQWQDAIAFVVLLAFLLFRPQGFFGREVRSASV